MDSSPLTFLLPNLAAWCFFEEAEVFCNVVGARCSSLCSVFCMFTFFSVIQNILIRRKKSDTYLATVSRHHWSLQVTMKVDKICWLKAKHFIYFHRDLQTPAMSTDSSQVGVALFPSYWYIFYHFTFPGFPFILIFFWVKDFLEVYCKTIMRATASLLGLFL